MVGRPKTNTISNAHLGILRRGLYSRFRTMINKRKFNAEEQAEAKGRIEKTALKRMEKDHGGVATLGKVANHNLIEWLMHHGVQVPEATRMYILADGAVPECNFSYIIAIDDQGKEYHLEEFRSITDKLDAAGWRDFYRNPLFGGQGDRKIVSLIYSHYVEIMESQLDGTRDKEETRVIL